MYTFHSMVAPYSQENAFLNDCWRSKYGIFYLDKFCQVFITRIPALSKEASTSRDTVSFESACRPGYFLRQKNYHFILQKRDGTELFGRYTWESFAFRSKPRDVVLPYISYDMWACAAPNGTVFDTKMGIALPIMVYISEYGYGFKWNHENV